MPICLAQEADMSVLVQQELIKQVAGTPATVALKYTMRPKERTMAAKLPVMHLLCKHHHQAPSSSTIITRNKKDITARAAEQLCASKDVCHTTGSAQ
jgi:hypothetical protein